MRIIFCVAVSLLLSALVFQTKAVEIDSPKKGDHLITANIGLYGLGLNGAYDYTLKKVGPGSFTIGGQLGYAWDYNYVSEISLAVRTTYRMTFIKKWDFYVGTYLGGTVEFYHDWYYGIYGGVAFGSFVGAGYRVTEKISLGLEVGVGFFSASHINIGATFRL